MPEETRVAVRDAEATRRRILQAATTEFAAYGLAGGRVARIAAAARANQRMIYAYYGSKDGLFDAVLAHHVAAAHAAVPFDAEDLPGHAQRVFDFYRAHPEMVRLALWQSLERPELMGRLPEVAAALAEKTAAVGRAQEAGHLTSEVPADRLLDQVLTLAHGNITGAARPGTWTEQQREALGRAVAALVGPRPAEAPRAADGGGA
ncbi:TetR family transcriptional regulator [Streptomyces albidoflavus]